MSKIDHIPMQMPRDNHEGEHAFYSGWLAFANAKPEKAKVAIMGERSYDTLAQRAATVAASFMVWMGNNNGYSLRHECKRRMAGAAWPMKTLIGCWAEHNMRSFGVNSGLRTVEVMLAERHPYGPGVGARVDRSLIPTITMDDLEVIESMLVWLMTDQDGKRICKDAEAEADEGRRAKLASLHVGVPR